MVGLSAAMGLARVVSEYIVARDRQVKAVDLLEVLGFALSSLTMPLLLLGLIGLLTVFTDERWQRPSWDRNPFSQTQPIQFFHAGAFFVLAGSAPPTLLGWVASWHTVVQGSAMMIAGGVCWASVWLCVRVYWWNFEPAETTHPSETT